MSNIKIDKALKIPHFGQEQKYVSPWTAINERGQEGKTKRSTAAVPGGKMVRWTPKETQRLEDLKAQAIEAKIDGDTQGAIDAMKEIDDLKRTVRSRRQHRARRVKPCKGVVHVTVTSKKDAGRIAEGLIKRSTKMMG